MPEMSIIMDIVIVLLLGITLVYVALLNRRLSRLHTGRDELGRQIKALNAGVNCTEAAVHGMRETAISVATDMQNHINAARELSSELEIIIGSGHNLADRLANDAGNMRRKAGANRLAQTEIQADRNKSLGDDTVSKSDKRKKNAHHDRGGSKVVRSRMEQELLDVIQGIKQT